MKRFITLFILAAVVFMIPDMAGAFAIKVLGTGNNSYYVYDSERKQIGDAQTIIDEDEEDGVEISDEGTYTVELSDVSREITVEDDVTLVSGSVLVFGWGTDPYDLYDEDDNKLGGAETGEYTDMFTGSYTVRLNDTSQPATVVSGARTFLGAGAILVRGTGTDRYDVYDADENKLGDNDTEGDVELFPGTYTVELNKTRETEITVEAFRRSVLKAGAIKITGTGSDSYDVCDLDENDLGSADTDEYFEIFEGEYTVTLNGISKTVNVEASAREIIDSGAVTVSRTEKDSYHIYDTDENELGSAKTNRHYRK